MAIIPISMPNAAATNYGDGDVRHFSDRDALDIPGLQNPTRMLAYRDVLLAGKVNEVITTVNNKEQFVPIPIPRTTVSQSTEEVVYNQRIPAGFEARVINATINSNPVNSDIELIVYYAATFGNSTGTSIVNTSSEYTAGTEFYTNGEFIVVLKNKSSVTLDIVASVTLTIRPVGETSSLLIAAATPVMKGPPGTQGPPGSGTGGTAGAPGSAGLTWVGTWYGTVAYNPGQVVGHVYTGTSAVQSAWVCKATTVAGEEPGVATTKWDLLASGGASGSAGEAGLLYVSTWSGSSVSYIVNDVVDHTISGVKTFYICKLAHTSGATSEPGVGGTWGSYWTEWFVVGETPTYDHANITATYTSTGTTSSDGDYAAVGTSGNLTMTEYKVSSSTGTHKGLVFLYDQRLFNAAGASTFVITLPTSSFTSAQYTAASTWCQVVTHGTRAVETSSVQLLDVSSSGSVWTISVLSAATQHISITIFGMQTL